MYRHQQNASKTVLPFPKGGSTPPELTVQMILVGTFLILYHGFYTGQYTFPLRTRGTGVTNTFSFLSVFISFVHKCVNQRLKGYTCFEGPSFLPIRLPKNGWRTKLEVHLYGWGPLERLHPTVICRIDHQSRLNPPLELCRRWWQTVPSRGIKDVQGGQRVHL